MLFLRFGCMFYFVPHMKRNVLIVPFCHDPSFFCTNHLVHIHTSPHKFNPDFGLKSLGNWTAAKFLLKIFISRLKVIIQCWHLFLLFQLVWSNQDIFIHWDCPILFLFLPFYVYIYVHHQCFICGENAHKRQQRIKRTSKLGVQGSSVFLGLYTTWCTYPSYFVPNHSKFERPLNENLNKPRVTV